MENFDKKKYEKAKKRVKDEKDFYTHLTVYIVVNVVLIVARIGIFENGLSHIDIPNWSLFTTPFFWGIGLFFHWLSVFKNKIGFLKSWEERKIKEYMEKEEDEIKRSKRY